MTTSDPKTSGAVADSADVGREDLPLALKLLTRGDSVLERDGAMPEQKIVVKSLGIKPDE
jgi:hypothetical protein